MNTATDLDRLLAGVIDGADSLSAAAGRLAAEPTAETARQLTARAENFLHGCQRTTRALIEAETVQIEPRSGEI